MDAILPVCAIAAVLQAVYGLVWFYEAKNRPVVFGFSVITAIGPVSTLILVVRVFVVGGSSHTAQLAAPDGFALWSLWTRSWPWLLMADAVAVLIGIVAIAVPPYPRSDRTSYLSRLIGLVAAGFALLLVMSLVPDA